MKRWQTLIGLLLVLTGSPASAQNAGDPAGGAAGDLRASKEIPFADVPAEHWAAMAILALASPVVFTGYPDATFGGKHALTRYEFAVALQRAQHDVARQLGGLSISQGPGPTGRPGPQGPPGPPGSPTPAEVEQLKRDIEALKQIFTELQDRAAVMRRDVDELRRQIGTVEPRGR